MMLYIHENNIQNKIGSNYKYLREQLCEFYKKQYLPTRKHLDSLNFQDGSMETFIDAAKVFNYYYDQAYAFQQKYKIDTRSKFLSTIYEEMSVYLFRGHSLIRSGVLSVFNKGIYAGLKFVDANSISVIKKDVDFCIGKRVEIRIEGSKETEIILPVVCVEVKTYLDATMFGEVKSSSKALRSATPNSKAYVLMGHKELADEHIIAARQDSTLTEMFALRKNENSPIDAETLHAYWEEIVTALDSISEPVSVSTPGRLLFPHM